MQPGLSKPVCASLLPATVADLVLQRLQAAGYAPFNPAVIAPLGLGLHVRLMWNGWRGVF